MSWQQADRFLRDGLDALAIALSEEQIEKLMLFLNELQCWNQKFNLSAIREPVAMVQLHLLDSLTLYPLLQSFCQYSAVNHPEHTIRLLDVGTGAGLPGVPLAIALSGVSVTLLDSNHKKTQFLFQTLIKLSISNATVETSRVELYAAAHPFDLIVSRAFSSLREMVASSKHLLSADGQFWAMKGVYPEEELVQCSEARLLDVHTLQVPELDVRRHLLVMKSKSP